MHQEPMAGRHPDLSPTIQGQEPWIRRCRASLVELEGSITCMKDLVTIDEVYDTGPRSSP